MGGPVLGSRWRKPSTFSLLRATADEAWIVIKSAMAGRFSKWGMWRFVNGTESLAGGSARTEREGPRRTRRTSRRTQEGLMDGEWGTRASRRVSQASKPVRKASKDAPGLKPT